MVAGSRPAQPVIEAAVVYGRDNGWVLATEDLRRGLAVRLFRELREEG